MTNSDVSNQAARTNQSTVVLTPPSVVKRLVGRSLKQIGYKLFNIGPQTNLVSQQIPGWFSVAEAEALYLLAATNSAKRILEVGHFLGRSTSAICEGIRDAGSTTEFDSYDLGFTNAQEFVAHYRRVHDTTSSEVPAEYDQLVFSQKNTTTEIAKRHLRRFDLDRFVNLISGDFTVLNRTKYDFIFCDAMHDHMEIAVNLPHVIAASNDNCVWAFHDMNSSNATAVLRRSPARLIRIIETLGIFRFRKQESDRTATSPIDNATGKLLES